MRFGISTHLFHDRRLERDHLAQIASYGFEAIEVFATRTHFDYHDEAAVARARRLAVGDRADAQQHSRADRGRPGRWPLGRAVLQRGRGQRAAAGGGARGRGGAAGRAPDSVRRPRRAPRHAGGKGAARRQQPGRRVPERRGHLPAGRAARRARGAGGDSERALERGVARRRCSKAIWMRRTPASAWTSATRT